MSDRLADLIVRSENWPKAFRMRMVKRPKVVCDELSAMYWLGKPVWSFSEDTGPLRLPYPHLWIEWRIPRYCVTVDPGDEVVSPLRQAAVAVHEVEKDHPDFQVGGRFQVPADAPVRRGSRWLLFDIWQQQRGGQQKIVRSPLTALLATDDMGSYVAHLVLIPLSHPGLTPDRFREMAPSADMAIWPACLAIGFMNCRNVSLTEPEPGTRRRRGRGEAKPQKYRRIIVPGQPAHKSDANGGGDPAALHVVRGHFKTYTSDAPLMGAHTGTYWWSHHARGKGEGKPRTPEYEVR